MQATFKPDGTRLAAIGTNSNTLYILSSGNSTFTISQSINLGSPPNSITWSVNGERLIAGLRNGTVEVFGLNTTNQYDQVQLLGTNHSSIAYVAGVKSRFATCGTSDQSVNIFYYNTTTKQYSLNQTVSGLPGTGCSAIDYSPLENRIAVGRTDGSVALLLRDANYIYSISNNISAHNTNVNFVKWSGDSVYLLTAGSTDSTVKLWTGANNFAGSTSSKTMKGQSATYSTINEKFAIGTFDDKAGTIAIEMLKATNCANATVADNPSVCNCNSG
jgi:WD40 repeat protein